MSSRILIYGAGAIGSIFAGKLAKRGNDVTVLARGDRYAEIEKRGIILRSALSNKTETVRVKCVRELREDDAYDYVLIVVQANQIEPILPILGKNKSQNLVFVVNNPLGYAKYIAAVGRERVMLGFPSAGGERANGIVTYFIGTGLAKTMQATTFGEADGSVTDRLKRLVRIFRDAGFSPTISRNMDAWQKTHIAFVVPISNALLQFDSDNKRLAKSRKTINEMILATREGLAALKGIGIPVEPKRLNYYYLPKWLLCAAYQALFLTRISEYAMAKHTIVAKREIDLLEEQFLSLFPGSDFYHWRGLRPRPRLE